MPLISNCSARPRPQYWKMLHASLLTDLAAAGKVTCRFANAHLGRRLNFPVDVLSRPPVANGRCAPLLRWPISLRTAGRAPAPRTHRNEFPAEYSLAGCSPAWPASVSSAGFILHPSTTFEKLFSANGNRRIYSLSQERAQGTFRVLNFIYNYLPIWVDQVQFGAQNPQPPKFPIMQQSSWQQIALGFVDQSGSTARFRCTCT